MFVTITKECLVGSRSYNPGEKADVSETAAQRLIKFGAATVCLDEPEEIAPEVETADASPHSEFASAEPGKRRKA